MNYSILILIIFSWVNFSLAQNPFSKSFDLNVHNEYGTCIKEWNDDIVVYCASVCAGENNPFCNQLLKIDKKGEIKWIKTLNFEKRASDVGSYGLTFIDSNLLTGYTVDIPGETQYPELKLISPSGDSLWSFHIQKGNNLILRAHIVTDSGNIIMCASLKELVNNWPTLYLIKIDQQGNIIWEKKYKDSKYNYLQPEALYPMSNDQFLMTSTFCDSFARCGYFGKHLWLMDRDGNVIWRRDHEQDNTGRNPSLVGFSNGLSVIGYQTEKKDPRVGAPACIKAYNRQGDSLWEYCLETKVGMDLYKLAKTSNGDIIGCGNEYIPRPPGWTPYFFRLSPEGKLIWKRFVYYDKDPSLIGRYGGWTYGITEDSEGNIWATGDVRDTFPDHDPTYNSHNVWVLKLSSDGCLLPNCTEDVQYVSDVITSSEGIFMYKEDLHRVVLSPNPTVGVFHIKTKDQSMISSCEIYDISGQQVMYKEKINQSLLKVDLGGQHEGMYLVKIILDDGNTISKKIIIE